MARHSVNGDEKTACSSTQRFASLSYCAMTSPSLLVSQGAPKPVHKVLPIAGPYRAVNGAVLLNTANEVFTNWTYCDAPAAPLVSGGITPTVNVPPGPEKPVPTPRKLDDAGTAAPMALDCRTGSVRAGPDLGAPFDFRRRGIWLCGPAGGVMGLMSRRGGDWS